MAQPHREADQRGRSRCAPGRGGRSCHIRGVFFGGGKETKGGPPREPLPVVVLYPLFSAPAHTPPAKNIRATRSDRPDYVCVVCVTRNTRAALGVLVLELAGTPNPEARKTALRESDILAAASSPRSGETFSREKAREQEEGKDWRQALQWPSSCESQRMADGAQTDAIEPAWNSCCDACSCSDAVRQQGWQTLWGDNRTNAANRACRRSPRGLVARALAPRRHVAGVSAGADGADRHAVGRSRHRRRRVAAAPRHQEHYRQDCAVCRTEWAGV